MKQWEVLEDVQIASHWVVFSCIEKKIQAGGKQFQIT